MGDNSFSFLKEKNHKSNLCGSSGSRRAPFSVPECTDQFVLTAFPLSPAEEEQVLGSFCSGSEQSVSVA